MSTDRALKHFSELFWKARKLKIRGDGEEAVKKFRAARRYALEKGLRREADVAEAACLEVESRLDEAAAVLAKALKGRLLHVRGLAHFLMGSIHGAKAEWDEAIAWYRKAIESPDFDIPANAWNNMGYAHSRKGEYDKAISCYQKALDAPNYDTPGKGWVNMGNAYSGKGEYDQAISCFQKALSVRNYDTPGNAWFNMGSAHRWRGDEAAAIQCWRTAAGLFENSDKTDWAALARRMIAAARLKPEGRSSTDRALLQLSATVVELEGGVESVEAIIRARNAKAQETAYERYAAMESSDLEDVLAVLKGWGSAVPLVQGGATGCRGGGYFLKWTGRGLVLDPGYDFLRNFREAGFHARETKVVVVTHNHSDHNQDLRALDDIHYEMFKASGQDREWEYTLLWDKDTAENNKFTSADAAHRPDPVQFDLGRVRRGIEESIDLRGQKGLPFNVKYFKAQHSPDVQHAVGLRIECYGEKGKAPAFVLGYSSDTEFYPALCDKDHLGGCDLLIAHVSQPDEEEFESTATSEHLKEAHLGYQGTVRLIRGSEPKLTVICEFWSGIADFRVLLVQGLRKQCGTQAILPGGNGLFIKPRTLDVRCTACREWCHFSEVSVAGPENPFGPLKYLCPNCSLSAW